MALYSGSLRHDNHKPGHGGAFVSMNLFVQLWQRLSDAPAAVVDPLRRHQVRLLSGLLLVSMLFGLASAMLQWLMLPAFSPILTIATVAMLSQAVAYVITRKGYYIAGAMLAIAVIMLASFAAIAVSPADSMAYAYLIVSIFLARLFFATRGVLIVTAANLFFLLFLFPALGLAPQAGNLFAAPVFMVIFALLMLLAMRYRDAIEFDRRAQLAASEAQLRTLAALSPVGVYRTDRKGQCVYVNESWCSIAGMRAEQAYGFGWTSAVSPEDRARVEKLWKEAIDHGLPFETEMRLITASGASRWVLDRAAPEMDAQGVLCGYVGSLTDITERQRSEERVLQLNRLLHTITEINQMVVRERSRERLLAESCRILTEHGEYLLAWVGLVDQASGTVRVAARAGSQDDYLQETDIRWDDSPLGRGPTGRAIRDGRAMINNDMETDPDYAPWRARAQQHGFRASAALPLRVSGQIIGAINVYAAQPGAFQDDEVVLLNELVEDLGYAMQMLDVTAAREHAERALSQSEENFRALTENANVGILVNARGKHVFANTRLLNLLGYTQDELRETGVKDLVHPQEYDKVAARFRERLDGQPVPGVYETVFMTKSGQAVPVELTAARTTWQGEPAGLVMLQDIRERLRAETQMRKLSSALEQTADTVVITDRQGIIEYVNPGFEKTTGYTRDEALGQTPRLVKSGKQGAGFYKKLWETILAGDVFNDVFVNRRKDGSLYYEEKTITPLKDAAGEITHFVATGKDVTERMQAQERLQHMAQHDALTELPNRLLYIDRLKQALARARWHERLVAVLFVDMDRFKNINDTLGHEVGDQLLQALAARLAAGVREGDTVARFGGDEFVILLDDVGSEKDIGAVAQKVLDTLAPPFVIDGQSLYVTASIGVSLYPNDGEDSGTLIKNADIAMYRAKDLGKNTYQFYSADMSARAFERLTLESSLRHAIERKEFRLYYQPQIDTANGTILGVEALLRWEHPDFGLVAPGEFIPLLEETGLIVPVGDWVFQTACAQLCAWNAAGWPALRMAVNLSPRQLQDTGLEMMVERVLAAAGCDPRLIELEITENVLLRHAATTLETLDALRALGVRLAIDDFGTGYSSLSYLRRYSIDTLKVDRSFVHDVPGDADDCALATAIIVLAQSLKLDVIAEGVETEAQRAFLQERGCHQMQGYLFSRPVPAGEIPRLLEARNPKG